MELSSLLVQEKTIQVEYPDPEMEGFIVEVSYVGREILKKIRNKCLVTKFDRKTHKATEEVDDKLFLKLYVQKVIKGWKGLKMTYLQDLLPVDISSSKPEDELEYTEDNALVLMQNSTTFDQWITEVVSDITAFNKNS